MATIWVLRQTKTYLLQALSMAIALLGSSNRTTKGDRRLGPLRVLDRVITCLRPSRIADFKTSIPCLKKKKEGGGGVAQFTAWSTSLCVRLFLERRRQCRNTCVRKTSKQKHLRKVITVKRKRFRHVKTISLFPLNKMFHIDYKTA